MDEEIRDDAGRDAGSGGVTVVGPGGRSAADLGGFGVVWKIDGADTDGRFAVVHHTIAPRLLAAPLHRHAREDEYTFVLEGRMGALLGDEVVEAGPGSWVFKPRNEWHTFWNAGDEPCHVIELISPAGFEGYFRGLAEAWPDVERFVALSEAYGLEMDFDSVERLCTRFGLVSEDPTP